MKIVIDIPEDDYKKLFTKAQTYLFEKDYLEDIADMVKNGTVLPNEMPWYLSIFNTELLKQKADDETKAKI